MRSYDKYRNSTYIQKTDVEAPQLLTIDCVKEEDVSQTDQPEEMKYVIYFKEDYKPWVPGIQMLEMINHINGSGNVDDWSGTKLVLFVDQNVAFRGKIVGGIRCRAPKNQQSPSTQPAGPNPDHVGNDPTPPDDDIPF